MPVKINFDKELEEGGCDLTRDPFYDIVLEVKGALCPDGSADELACHPAEALQFCQAVRHRAGGTIADHVIRHALMNARKQPGG
jgi:hypothetical protein